MSVLNKRNALLGWLVWAVAKRTAKKKVSNALPGDGDGGRKRVLVVPAVVAATVGGLLFWRRRQDDDTTDS